MFFLLSTFHTCPKTMVCMPVPPAETSVTAPQCTVASWVCTHRGHEVMSSYAQQHNKSVCLQYHIHFETKLSVENPDYFKVINVKKLSMSMLWRHTAEQKYSAFDNLGCNWRWVVSSMHWPALPTGKYSGTHRKKEAGWAVWPSLNGAGKETPDCLACSLISILSGLFHIPLLRT